MGRGAKNQHARRSEMRESQLRKINLNEEERVKDRLHSRKPNRRNDDWLDLPVEKRDPRANQAVERPPMFGKYFVLPIGAKQVYEDTIAFAGHMAMNDRKFFMTYIRLYHLFGQQLIRSAKPDRLKTKVVPSVSVRGAHLVSYKKLHPAHTFLWDSLQMAGFMGVVWAHASADLYQAYCFERSKQFSESYRVLHTIRNNVELAKAVLYNIGPGFVSGGTVNGVRLYRVVDEVAAQSYYESLVDEETELGLEVGERTNPFIDYLLKWRELGAEPWSGVGDPGWVAFLLGANGEATGLDDMSTLTKWKKPRVHGIVEELGIQQSAAMIQLCREMSWHSDTQEAAVEAPPPCRCCTSAKLIGRKRSSAGAVLDQMGSINGEVTGLDDMEDKAKPTCRGKFVVVPTGGSLKRLERKQSKKAQLSASSRSGNSSLSSRTTVLSSKAPIVQPRSTPAVAEGKKGLVDPPRPVKEEKAPEPPKRKFILVLCTKTDKFGFAEDKDGLVERNPDGIWVGLKNTYQATDTVRDNTLVEGVKTLSHGWCELGGNQTQCARSAFMSDITIPEFTYLDSDGNRVSSPAVTYDCLLRSVVLELEKHHPNSVVRPTTAASLETYLSLRMAEFKVRFEDCAAQMIAYKYHRMRYNTYLSFVTHVVTPVADPIFGSLANNRGLLQIHPGPWRWDSVTSVSKSYETVVLGYDYSVSDDEIPIVDPSGRMRRDAVFGSLKGCRLLESKLPRFDTMGVKIDRYYHTNFVRFHGDQISQDGVKQFQIYSVSAENMENALSRVVRTRDATSLGFSHSILCTLQASMAHRLWRSGLLSGDMAKAVNAKFMDDCVLLTGGEPLPVPLLAHGDFVLPGDANGVFIANASQQLSPLNRLLVSCGRHCRDRCETVLQRLLKRCNSGFIERLTASGTLAALTAYDKIAEAGGAVRDLITGREACVAVPHVKAALRANFVARQDFHHHSNLMENEVTANIKREIGKPGKAARLYMSYGAACMYANHLPEFLKLAFTQSFTFRTGPEDAVDVQIRVVGKPSDFDCDEVFQEMYRYLQMRNCIYYLIYSDDAVVCGNLGGRPFGYNVDISSCDSSNGFGIFMIVGQMLSGHNVELAIGLLKQCCMPIKLVNPENKQESCKLRLSGPFEGSGTTLTTVLNHVASLFIACNVVELLAWFALSDEHSVSYSIPNLIEIGAAWAGHSMTVTEWAGTDGVFFERMDFLKTHPVRDVDGNWRGMRCLGSFFRGFGSLDGDLTGERLGISPNKFRELGLVRAFELYAHAIVLGLVHEPSNRIMSAIRARFVGLKGEETRIVDELSQYKGRSRKTFVADENSLALRYGWYDSEVDELVRAIEMCKVGEEYSLSILTKMFYRDYSLE